MNVEDLLAQQLSERLRIDEDSRDRAIDNRCGWQMKGIKGWREGILSIHYYY